MVYFILKVLTASALSGLRWTLAQILTQKEDLGVVLVNMSNSDNWNIKIEYFKKHLFIFNSYGFKTFITVLYTKHIP